ncbi:aldehyde ferredoxin oxidoreductase family protein, partial [candidate division CSSED10-310 bacterium]
MESKYKGYMGKYIDIDLSTEKIDVYDVPDEDKERYLGNKGMASKILYDNLRHGCDPLGKDNILILNTGPLTGSGAPTSARFNVACKSPLTGGIGTSNCGGDFGIYLKRAGYDGVILRGVAQKKSMIEIDEKGIRIKDAAKLWGLDTEETQEKLKKWPGRAVLGPAGENLVLYASITSNDRVAGRCGVGAVMGSKNVKAIVANGKQKVPVAHNEAFRQCVKDWNKVLRDHPSTGETLPKYGTASLVNITNATNTLGTRNFSGGHFEKGAMISGEYMAEHFLVKNKGCRLCPIQCGRIVKYKDKAIKGPEFETVGLMGSNLGIGDMATIIELNYITDLMGMDTISLGGAIGFATELCEKGMLDAGFKFGKTDHLPQLIKDIAYRKGIGDELANGTKLMADRFGGHEFAIHSKGLSFAAYEPRGAVGHGLGYATSNRGGCHLNGGYVVFFEATGPIIVDPLSDKGKPALAVFQQNTFDAVSSGGSCIFTTYAVIPKEAAYLNLFWPMPTIVSEVVKASRVLLDHQLKLPSWAAPIHLPLIPHTRTITTLTGMEMTLGNFLEAGDRIYNIERMFNVKQGITGKDDTLPYRMTHVAQRKSEPNSKVPLLIGRFVLCHIIIPCS